MNSLVSGLQRNYRKFFKIDELENSQTLQLSYWALLLVFIIEVVPKSTWIDGAQRIHKKDWHFTCWPHFQNCDQLFFFDNLPIDFSYAYFSMFIFAALLAALVGGVQKRWELAHFGMLILFIFKLSHHYVFSYGWSGNNEYYHLPFAAALLFFRHKEVFLKLLFVSLYSLAALARITDGWIEGSYFTSLSHGLALVPYDMIPLVTNFVILFEILCSWGLVSQHSRFQRLSFWGWIGFHFYSITLVGFIFPIHCVPLLIILFGSGVQKMNLPSYKVGWMGYLTLVFLVVLNLGFKFYPRDLRYTGESHQYTLSMMSANYQCEMQWKVFGQNGEMIEEVRRSSSNSAQRCPVYFTWFRLNKRCERDPLVNRISFQHSISVNGGPFYQVVDTENACDLDYSLFKEKKWIKTPEDGAQIVGYPRPNQFRPNPYAPEAQVIFNTPSERPAPRINFQSIGDDLKIFYLLLWAGYNLFMVRKRNLL